MSDGREEHASPGTIQVSAKRIPARNTRSGKPEASAWDAWKLAWLPREVSELSLQLPGVCTTGSLESSTEQGSVVVLHLKACPRVSSGTVHVRSMHSSGRVSLAEEDSAANISPK